MCPWGILRSHLEGILRGILKGFQTLLNGTPSKELLVEGGEVGLKTQHKQTGLL